MLARQYLNADTKDDFFDTIRLLSVELLHARISLYTVDPRGTPSITYSGNPDPRISANPNAGGEAALTPTGQVFGNYLQSIITNGSLNFPDLALRRFAQETGGATFWGRNDLDAQIAASSRDGAHYYTLSYYPSNHNFDGKFRLISVKVNRAGAHARTRAGYFALAEPSAATPEQILEEVEQALGNPLPYAAVRVSASTALVKGEVGTREVSLHIDPRDVTWTAGSRGRPECTITATTAAFSGKPVPEHIQRREFQGKMGTGHTVASLLEPVTVSFKVPVGERVSRLRVVVRDEGSGSMGTADVTIDSTHAP
jgi:hypothetical protein